MTSQFWKLPVNWEELIEEVRWAAAGNLSLEVNAPLTVAAELTVQNRRNKFLVHLLNYNVARTSSATDIGVILQIPGRENVRSVSLLSPDGEGIHSPPFTIEDGEVRFVVPRLKTYTLAVIQME